MSELFLSWRVLSFSCCVFVCDLFLFLHVYRVNQEGRQRSLELSVSQSFRSIWYRVILSRALASPMRVVDNPGSLDARLFP